MPDRPHGEPRSIRIGRSRRAREGQVTLGVVQKHEQDGQILRAEVQIDRPAEGSREPAEVASRICWKSSDDRDSSAGG